MTCDQHHQERIDLKSPRPLPTFNTGIFKKRKNKTAKGKQLKRKSKFCESMMTFIF